MVMRNRHDGSGSPGWWDSLPPRVRERFGTRPADYPDPGDPPPAPQSAPAPGRSALEWVHELIRLALLFLAVAVANLVFLLLALAFLDGRPGPQLLMPGR